MATSASPPRVSEGASLSSPPPSAPAARPAASLVHGQVPMAPSVVVARLICSRDCGARRYLELVHDALRRTVRSASFCHRALKPLFSLPLCASANVLLVARFARCSTAAEVLDARRKARHSL